LEIWGDVEWMEEWGWLLMFSNVLIRRKATPMPLLFDNATRCFNPGSQCGGEERQMGRMFRKKKKK